MQLGPERGVGVAIAKAVATEQQEMCIIINMVYTCTVDWEIIAGKIFHFLNFHVV